MASIITADDGSVSGTAGLKQTADSSGVLQLKVGDGTVTGLHVDAAGNIGFDGTTPKTWTNYSALEMAGASIMAAGNVETILAANGYYNSGWKYKNTAAASYYSQDAGAHSWAVAASGTAGNTISWTTAMTLNASGQLFFGASVLSSAGPLSVDNSTNVASIVAQASYGDGTPALNLRKSSSTSTTSQVFANFTISGASTGSGQINANGASQAAFGSFSDARLKENIVDLPPQLAAIVALRPVEFDYKDGSGHQIGFIAQEVQEIYPDLVGEREDGMLTLSGLGKNEARLVKAIQELAAEVAALKAK